MNKGRPGACACSLVHHVFGMEQYDSKRRVYINCNMWQTACACTGVDTWICRHVDMCGCLCGLQVWIVVINSATPSYPPGSMYPACNPQFSTQFSLVTAVYQCYCHCQCQGYDNCHSLMVLLSFLFCFGQKQESCIHSEPQTFPNTYYDYYRSYY